MARTRNIKPGLATNEELADLGPYSALLFALLPCFADREGRIEDRPKTIKALCLPFYDVDINSILEGLTSAGFLDRYEVDGIKVIQIVKFLTHQSPHPKETESNLPAMKSRGSSVASRDKSRRSREKKVDRICGIGIKDQGSGSDLGESAERGDKPPAPIYEGCEFFRATREQLKTAEKKLPTGLIGFAIGAVDNWLGGDTARAKQARKSPTHYRHLWAAWAIENAERLAKTQGGPSANFRKNLDVIAWAKEQDELEAAAK